MPPIKVKSVLNDFKSIFSNTHFFEPLEISTSHLYDMWVIKFFEYNYITDSAVDIAYMITTLNKIYENRFIKSVQALLSDYNPIENYNSTETETTNINGSTSTVSSGVNTTATEFSGNSTSENIETLSPYDTENFNNNSKNTMTDTNGSNTNTTINTSDTTSGNNTQEHNRTLKRSGNIGVTTTQQMLQSEFELRKTDLINDYFFIVQNYILSHKII